MAILNVNDFKGGKYNIPDASSATSAAGNVTAMIARYEKWYLRQLLGVDLGDLIYAYITTPLSGNTDYDKIIGAFAMDNPSGCSDEVINSQGLKEYLKAAIYYEYQKNGLKLTQAGVAKGEGETSTVQGTLGTMRFAENKFNDVLDTIEAIQWYCRDNDTAFPDFNGQPIKAKFAGGII